MQSIYSVVIAGVTGSAPSDGFIDNTTILQYMAAGSEPTTLDQSTSKVRGNIRFKLLQQQIQLESNVYMDEYVAAGGSAIAQPTSFAFTATVEHGDDSLFTRDETNANAPLTGVDALKRWIARSMILGTTLLHEVYDPTQATSRGAIEPFARDTTVDLLVTAGALCADLTTATALITVSKIA
jgi:hypothetical protein